MTPLMGIVIRTEINPETGQQVMEDISPEGDTYTLGELYKITRCNMIELVRLEIDGVEKLMVVDEEGMMRNKPTNNAATDVLWENNPVHRNFTVLLGDVAIIDNHEVN